MTAPRGSAVRRTGQLLTGFGSLVVLVALLLGAPVALLAFAGNPLPDHLPTLSEVGTTLTSRDDGRLFLRALAVLGWFGWATFAFSVLVELGAQAARRPAPRLPGMSRQQRAAATLVGSVALIIAASPAASAAAAMSYPATATTGHPATVTLAAPHTGPTGAVPEGSGADIARPQPATAPPVYRVAKGDYLGEVAERYLDDFDRYREVARINRLHDPDRIRPGQLIKLPARAEDGGAREHATGRLVAGVSTPRKPSPHPPAASPTSPKGSPGSTGSPVPDEQGGPVTPGGQVTPGTPGGRVGPATPHGNGGSPTGQPVPQTVPPQVERSAGAPPAMAAGASRATDDDGMNRPLAVSAVLAVASIVGAQLGAVLGLRRRPARAVAAARALASGRHRRS